MQFASSMNYISEKRKYSIKNDSIYHLSFGTPVERVGKLTLIDNNRFKIFYPHDSSLIEFQRMDVEIDDSLTYDQFYEGFNKRREEADCFTDHERKIRTLIKK